MSNSLGNFSLIYNLCPKSNLSTGQKFSDLSTTNATYRFIYELQILSRALYRPRYERKRARGNSKTTGIKTE